MADDKTTCVEGIKAEMEADSVAQGEPIASANSPVGNGRKFARKLGTMPLFAVGGMLAVTVGWALAANDPYWRLNGSEPMPPSTYHRDPGPDPLEGVGRPSTALAAINRIAANVVEPKIRLTPLAAYGEPVLPQNLAGVATGFGLPPAPRIAQASRAGLDDANVAIALAPLPMPAQADLPDERLPAHENVMALPEMTRHAPIQPHFAADESTEDALSLDRTKRADVQRRLALAGFDPAGADGVFGPRTRGAIEAFQAAWGYPATGYLEPAVYADLNQRTEEAYQALNRRVAKTPRATSTEEPDTSEASAPGACARDGSGQVVARQSLKCDLVGFSETFVSLNRNTIDDEDADARLESRAGRE